MSFEWEHNLWMENCPFPCPDPYPELHMRLSPRHHDIMIIMCLCGLSDYTVSGLKCQSI
jgi:hypothetical protein